MKVLLHEEEKNRLKNNKYKLWKAKKFFIRENLLSKLDRLCTTQPTYFFLQRRIILLSFARRVLHFMLLNDHKKSFWEI